MNPCKSLGAKFAHHHVHTEYSPQDAPVSLTKLVEYTKHLGYKTCTVTDHGTLASWVKLQKLCKTNDLRPIFGIEGYFANERLVKEGKRSNYHILLLAKNKEGIKNIFKLSELAWKEGYFYDPRMDWELLEKYHEGVICTSACVGGIIPDTIIGDPKNGVKGDYDAAKKHAERFKNIFKDDFYIEVQYHNLGIENVYLDMARMAREMGIKIVGTNDVHYLRKEDWGTQEALMALNTGRCMKDESRMKHETNQFYLKSPEEMLEMFGGSHSQAVESTLEIADKCDAMLEFGKVQLPSIGIPKESKSETDYLETLSKQGLARLGLDKNPVYVARFEREMGVIRKLADKGFRFDRYFLIVADYVQAAKDRGIMVGVGRGSGAASLVLYGLGITGIDPIKYDLLFERFLTEDRNEMPDIDIDFDYERGAEVYTYVQEKYGADRCAKIGTVGVFHTASAIKAAYRVFDPGDTWEKSQRAKEVAKQQHAIKGKKNSKRSAADSKEIDETFAMANGVTKSLPRAQNGKTPSDKCTLSREVADKDPDRIYVYDCQECGSQYRELRRTYPEIMAFAESIEGLIERRGTHAAGVLLTESPTIESFPQQFSGKNKELSTAFDMADIEQLGGIKFDYLRVKPLSVFKRCDKALRDKGLWRWDFDIHHLPDDDKKVLDLFARGDTLAIFQFEGDGMRRTLKEMRPTRFEDLIVANALYRPGPIEFIKSYNDRKNGAEKVSYPCQAAAEALSPTYGIMVYQEQVMKLVMVLAGFNGSESDKVRKAIGKKKKEILDQLRDKFMDGCKKVGSCSADVASMLWDQMEKFGSYAFNKAHAASYAFIAYQCAWLKAYFPAEFMSAQLTVEGIDGQWEVVDLYESGCRSMGLSLLPADINKSKVEYFVDADGRVRRGFCGVKGVGEVAYNDIIKAQPYADMYDYCERSGNGAKSNVATALIDVGAFDWLKPSLKNKLGREVNRTDIVRHYEDMAKRASTEKKSSAARQEEKEGIGNIFDDSFSL